MKKEERVMDELMDVNIEFKMSNLVKASFM
jgi:hypothetical protein